MAISASRLGQRLALLALIAGLSGCLEALPGGRLVDEVMIPLPNEGRLLVSYRERMIMPNFEASAINRHGSSHQNLWENWGPANRGNVYLTSDDRVVIVGSGGFVYMFEMHDGKAPRVIEEDLPPRGSGQDWEYVGAFILNSGELAFYSPSKVKERIALLGAGSTPYRPAAQVPHS